MIIEWRGPRDEQQVLGRPQAGDWLSRIIAALPRRVGFDPINCQLAPHPVEARDLDRLAGHRHQCAREIRIGFAPDEAVHAAHRRAHNEPQVGDTEALDQHAVLRCDHVVIIIFGEVHPRPVRRLGRPAVADIVRQDEPVAADVERLIRTVELVGELRLEELLAGAAGAVEDHHRIVDLPGRVAMWAPKRRHMHLQLGQCLAVAETEVLEDNVLLVRGPRLFRRLRRPAAPTHRRRCRGSSKQCEQSKHLLSFQLYLERVEQRQLAWKHHCPGLSK